MKSTWLAHRAHTHGHLFLKLCPVLHILHSIVYITIAKQPSINSHEVDHVAAPTPQL